ncbi:putative membrane protein [Microbacteriaceae bacterium SG_E_30_P1]|uniref:Membrane protein n=1 Tax=Antiquaquibacter oligotrophicus TaxID=2880260 RepID=A0ABT6KQ79_9MICO|nr:SRPBCC family protein [Antiquaquibacter oligotrophicus]MDH6182133.1 putative membrane protein [Antiquaquibacter oligotrophicus]UDF12204.1 SRPBCC family protein [Antiquaquibacter oligotrophicus]
MAQVVETIDVDVPVTIAYNQWTQFESFPEFLSVVDTIVQVDDVTNHWTVTVGGATREFDTVITEQLPDDRIAWTSTGGEVDHAGVVTFHKLSDTSSRVAVQIDWDPEGFVETAGAALHIPNHAVKKELENFKKYIEAKGIADGAWRGSVDN